MSRWLLLLLLATPALLFAQAPGDAATMPADAVEGLPPAAGAGGTKAAQLAEVESLEPAVDVGFQTSTQAQSPRQAVIQRSAAMDELDLGTTSITGNQELPKVLYIVPWKKSDLGDLVGRPVNTLLDEVLAPVDPEVFKRHLNYYDALHGAGAQE
jgi:hypothetical protein